MSKEEKNRRIAEWLEPLSTLPEWSQYFQSIGTGKAETYQAWRFNDADWQPRDFFTDERANALVLEKIRESFHVNVSLRTLVKVCIHFRRTQLGKRSSKWKLLYAEDPDKKTAIAEAALKLIEAHP